MRSYPALRLGAQAFLCAAVLSLFPVFRRDRQLLVLVPLLILAAAMLAVRLKNRWLRLLPCLVPAAALLLPVSGWYGYAAAAGMTLYAAAALARGEISPAPDDYRLEAKVTLAITGVLMIIALLCARSPVTLWLLICAALLVLTALQCFMISASMGLGWRLANFGVLILVLALGVGVGLLIRSAVPGFFRIFRSLAYGVFYLLVMIPRWILGLFGQWETVPPVPDENKLPVMETAEQGGENSGVRNSSKPSGTLQVSRIPWMEILTVVVVLLLIVLAIVLLRRRRQLRPKKTQTMRANEKAQPEKRSKRRKQRQEPKSNRGRVRFLYSRYLDYLRNHGLRLADSNTTAEISEASSELLLQTDELLRGLYRKARYSSEEIDDADIRAAEDSFFRLLAQDNLKKHGR